MKSRREDLDAFGKGLERVECRYVAVPADDARHERGVLHLAREALQGRRARASRRSRPVSDEQRDDVLRSLAVERRDRRPGETHYRTDAFAGFDLLGYGLRVLDQWAAAWHPMKNEDHPRDF